MSDGCAMIYKSLIKKPDGIYTSKESNAFTTRYSRHHALVAFSSTLLEKFDDQSIAAIAARSRIAKKQVIRMRHKKDRLNRIIFRIYVATWTYRVQRLHYTILINHDFTDDNIINWG
jgi:hypothetical protein